MCRQGCEPISILCLHYEWGKPELMQLHGGYLHDDHPHGRPKTKHLVHWQGRIFGATWIGHAPRLPQWFFGLAEFGHPGVAIWCPHRKCNDAEHLATFDPKRVESRWHFARGWVQNCHPEGQGTSPKSKIWMNQPIGLMDLVGGWPTPEKMWKSVGMMTFPIYGKKHVPNHQSVLELGCHVRWWGSFFIGFTTSKPQHWRKMLQEMRWFSDILSPHRPTPEMRPAALK